MMVTYYVIALVRRQKLKLKGVKQGSSNSYIYQLESAIVSWNADSEYALQLTGENMEATSSGKASSHWLRQIDDNEA